MGRLDRDSLRFDLEESLQEILAFIRRTVEEAESSGVVIGLSGGVDSALTAALCVRALGEERVLAVLMPASFTPEEDLADALKLAEMLGIRTVRVDIDGICEAFAEAAEIREDDVGIRIPLANVRARVRMTILYFFANTNNLLVAGTGDRSERLIGYFTKYGDGAADFFPIRHLYKTQVRELAKYLSVPRRIAYKPSSPQLYPGHKLSDEVPLGYESLDPVLVGLFDCRLSPDEVSRMTNVPLEIVTDVLRRHERTEHKRRPPPSVENRRAKENRENS